MMGNWQPWDDGSMLPGRLGVGAQFRGFGLIEQIQLQRIQARRRQLMRQVQRLQALENAIQESLGEGSSDLYDTTGYTAEVQPRRNESPRRPRRDDVFDAFVDIPEDEFTKDGRPELEAVNQRLERRGFGRINAAARDRFWDRYREEMGYE
jgi:hypothetical protein